MASGNADRQLPVTGNASVTRKALLDALSLPAFILFFTMMGFGSLARGAGFDAGMAAVASLLIWGLPGQLAMVELTRTGQGLVAIVFACSLANARFLPMVVSPDWLRCATGNPTADAGQAVPCVPPFGPHEMKSIPRGVELTP